MTRSRVSSMYFKYFSFLLKIRQLLLRSRFLLVRKIPQKNVVVSEGFQRKSLPLSKNRETSLVHESFNQTWIESVGPEVIGIGFEVN